MKKRWLWIGGWGLAPEGLLETVTRFFPDWRHRVIPPGENWRREFLENRHERAGGHSLGGRLLLELSLEEIPSPHAPPLLLAPFLPPQQDEGEAGRRQHKAFRLLEKTLESSPLQALALFHRFSGLGLPAPKSLPYSLGDLRWGLRFLALNPSPTDLPPGWECWFGEDDPLLEGKRLRQKYPPAKFLPGTGHDPADLIKGIKGYGLA